MITLTNLRTTDSIVLNYKGPYLIQNGGVDFGEITSTIATSKFYKQVGETINATKWGTRVITITGYVMGDEYSTLETKRKYIDRMINLDDDIQVDVLDRYIIGKPRQTLRWGKTEQENNELWCKFTIELFCSNPLFFAKTMQEYNLSTWSNALEWPLEIPTTGMEFETVLEASIKNINVLGDIEVPIVVKFIARSAVVNPKIINITTQKYIEIITSMQTGDYIEINTERSKQSIKLTRNNATTNIFVLRNKLSTLDMHLPVSITPMVVSATSGINALSATLSFNDRFLGVEWQC